MLKVIRASLVLLFFFSFNVNAQRLPLWELGAAIGYAKLPYYRGSTQSRDVYLPLPLAMYRGPKVSVDEDGARRWLFKTKYTKLDLSLGLGLPVPKDAQIESRKGMPSLQTLLEAG
ncbi:MAG: hypothetical protein R3240_04585, partial [Gammaproteobacteria bacterium]|nr:hypothetical protein [Gammaproteobacteria bacterium]